LNYTDIITIDDFQALGDTLYANFYENRTTPNFPGEIYSKIWNDTVMMAYGTYYFSSDATTQQRQMYSVPLPTQLLGYMENAMNGSSSLEFVFLSGHDDTLLPLITALNITTPECLWNNYINNITNDPICGYPIFASQVFFELYNDSNTWYVNTYYNDMPMMQPTYVEGQYQMKFGDFQNFLIQTAMGGYVMDDYYNFCGINQSLTPVEGNIKYTIYALTGVAGILLVILLVTISKKVGNASKAEGNMLLT